ncbi:hypothetical protein ACI3KU_18415, partial [Microbacterium sp. ZW T5_56]
PVTPYGAPVPPYGAPPSPYGVPAPGSGGAPAQPGHPAASQMTGTVVPSGRKKWVLPTLIAAGVLALLAIVAIIAGIAIQSSGATNDPEPAPAPATSSADPKPSATPKPTGTGKATPTPQATSTPKPSGTPRPSSTPKPSATAKPSPQPTASAQPTPKSTGTAGGEEGLPGTGSIETKLQALRDHYMQAREDGSLWTQIPDNEFNRTAVQAFLFIITDMKGATVFGVDAATAKEYETQAKQAEERLLAQEPLGIDIHIDTGKRVFEYDGDTGEGGYVN